MKTLVIYSQSFPSAVQAENWGRKQLNLMRKFKVGVFIISISKEFYVAREFSPLDNDPIFLRHEHDHYSTDGISLVDLIAQSKREGRASRFVAQRYGCVKEIS